MMRSGSFEAACYAWLVAELWLLAAHPILHCSELSNTCMRIRRGLHRCCAIEMSPRGDRCNCGSGSLAASAGIGAAEHSSKRG